MKTSKEEILITALKLFSVKGYSAVSMRDLSSAVGIKSSSLYNHFSSKEDILNTILDEAKHRYFDKRKTIDVPDNTDEAVTEKYNQMTKEKFLQICKELFIFYVEDPFMSSLRRFLCIEQFANKKIGSLYKKYFFDDIIASQSAAFESFVRAKKFKKCDPTILALHFYAPIFVCFTLYDNGLPKEEALKMVEAHAIQYSKDYNLQYDEAKGF